MEMGDIGARVEEGEKLWFAARSASEQRRALLVWLQGASHAVEDSCYSEHRQGSPGEALMAALENVELGKTPALFRPSHGEEAKVEPYDYLARAQAKAVVVVDSLVEYNAGSPGRRAGWALKIVSAANGMGLGALRSLRAHVHSGAKYARVRKHLEGARTDFDRHLKTARLMTNALRTGGYLPNGKESKVDESLDTAVGSFTNFQMLMWLVRDRVHFSN